MIESIDTTKVSPMMQHYIATKKEYSDCILFYRLGDFYEIFFDDALTASKELELTLQVRPAALKRGLLCAEFLFMLWILT